jgi:DNA polymerase-3 subunit chi
MAEVRFVQLDRQEKALHLCRIADRHFLAGARVLVVVGDENRAVTLDRFMWVWEKDSFLPHSLDNGTVDCMDEPVVISATERNSNQARVLVMGSPCSDEFIARFDLVFDFAETYDEQLAEAARARFRNYRSLGYKPSMDQPPASENPR